MLMKMSNTATITQFEALKSCYITEEFGEEGDEDDLQSALSSNVNFWLYVFVNTFFTLVGVWTRVTGSSNAFTLR